MNLSAPPPSPQQQTDGLGQSAHSQGFQVEFKPAQGRPISTHGSASKARPWPTTSPEEPKHSGRPMLGSPTAPASANGRGRAERETERAAGLGIRIGRPHGAGAGRVREPISGCGSWPRALGPSPPRAVVCGVDNRGSRVTTLAWRRAAARSQAAAAASTSPGRRPPAAAEPCR